MTAGWEMETSVELRSIIESDPDGDELVDWLRSQEGRVDVLVNWAAYPRLLQSGETAENMWCHWKFLSLHQICILGCCMIPGWYFDRF